MNLADLTAEDLRALEQRVGPSLWRQAVALRREAQLRKMPREHVERIWFHALSLAVYHRLLADRDGLDAEAMVIVRPEEIGSTEIGRPLTPPVS